MTTPEAALAAALQDVYGYRFPNAGPGDWASDAAYIIESMKVWRWVLTPVAPEVPPPGLREALKADVNALGNLTPEDWDERRGGDCIARTVNAVLDIIDARFSVVDGVREAHAGSQSAPSAATRTPEPPDSGDGGIDLAAILDEMDARIAEDDGKVPRSGWMTAQQIKQLGSLRGQSAAVGWLRNRLGLRSGSPAPEGGE